MDRDSDRQLAEGALAVLDNQINQTTGTIHIKGEFPNKDGALWPGEFLNIRLLARTAANVVTVPSSALQRGPNRLQMRKPITLYSNGSKRSARNYRSRRVQPEEDRRQKRVRDLAAPVEGNADMASLTRRSI